MTQSSNINPNQLDPQGRLRHFLALQHLPSAILQKLLEKADQFLSNDFQIVKNKSLLADKIVVPLFLEPSTRTRASFQIAAHNLGAHVLNINPAASSMTKGEDALDTIRTLAAMGPQIFVLRHAQEGICAQVVEALGEKIAVINAGEGCSEHPTQALLDMLTIRRYKGDDFTSLSVAFIGDIMHSRVAHSDIWALKALGVKDIRVSGPEALVPGHLTSLGVIVEPDVDKALSGVDVVVALRIQKERMYESHIPNNQHYFQQYGLTVQRLSKAKPKAIVMHPGPMNRGVEIASDVADGVQSVILKQVTCGVAARMAVLAMIAVQ